MYALLYRVPIPSSYNSISPAEQRKEMTQRSNKMRSFYGQRKHLAGESSLEYLNKMENEEFLEDLRGEDKAKLEEKRERINAKIEASMQEKRIILAAVQAVTRLRQLKEKKRLLRKARRAQKSQDDAEDEDDDEEEEEDEEESYEDIVNEDARAGLELLKSTGRIIDKDGKIRKKTLVEVAKDARTQKKKENEEKAMLREQQQLEIEQKLVQRKREAKKHRQRTSKGQPVMKNMVFDLLKKLKSNK